MLTLDQQPGAVHRTWRKCHVPLLLGLSPYSVLLLPKCPICAVGLLALFGMHVVIPPSIRTLIELCLVGPSIAWLLLSVGSGKHVRRSLWLLVMAAGLSVWGTAVERWLFWSSLTIFATTLLAVVIKRQRWLRPGALSRTR